MLGKESKENFWPKQPSFDHPICNIMYNGSESSPQFSFKTIPLKPDMESQCSTDFSITKLWQNKQIKTFAYDDVKSVVLYYSEFKT